MILGIGLGLVTLASIAAVVATGGGGDALPAGNQGAEQTTNSEVVVTSEEPSGSATESLPPDEGSDEEVPSTTTSAPPSTTTTLATVVLQDPQQLYVPPESVSATCQGNNGVEGDLVTPVLYLPSNVTDGRPETAWRCDTAEVLAGGITIDLGREVRLREIRLTAGYDKVDAYNGVDRFIQNHRVSRATWQFSDGTSVQAEYEDSRSPQGVAVDVATSSVTLIIEDYWPSTGTLARDMIALSEISLWALP